MRLRMRSRDLQKANRPRNRHSLKFGVLADARSGGHIVRGVRRLHRKRRIRQLLQLSRLSKVRQYRHPQTPRSNRAIQGGRVSIVSNARTGTSANKNLSGRASGSNARMAAHVVSGHAASAATVWIALTASNITPSRSAAPAVAISNRIPIRHSPSSRHSSSSLSKGAKSRVERHVQRALKSTYRQST